MRWNISNLKEDDKVKESVRLDKMLSEDKN